MPSSGARAVGALLTACAVHGFRVPAPHAFSASRQPTWRRIAANAAAQPPKSVPVPPAFLNSRQTHLEDIQDYRRRYTHSITDPSGFWGEIATQFHWDHPWENVVESNFDSSVGKVFSKWFSGGKTNICYNALDRHVAAGHGDQIAFHHAANDEDDDMPSWTYAQVLAEVNRLGSLLRSRGVKKGDRVSIFMPMVRTRPARAPPAGAVAAGLDAPPRASGECPPSRSSLVRRLRCLSSPSRCSRVRGSARSTRSSSADSARRCAAAAATAAILGV